MKLTHGLVVAGLLVICLCLVSPGSAWGTSMNIATVDSYTYSSTGTCTSNMGCYSPADYAKAGRTFTSLDITGVNAGTLAGKDTLVFWGKKPSELSATDKAAVNAWIANGGKLIIWDSEQAAYETFDYSWLTFPFSVDAPGQYGSTRKILIDMEPNQLGWIDASGVPWPYVNNYSIGWNTDAVGDSSIFTAESPTDWCVDYYTPSNVLGLKGPVHVYSKPIGSGIIIYCGLDWDYETADLKKVLRNEFDADSLPCSQQWTGNIQVTKVTDKAVYTKGDTITFTIAVTNPSDNPNSVYNAVMTDTPPSQVTLIDPATYDLGNIASGATITKTITATADTCGTNLVNNGAVVGKNVAGQKVYSGSQDAIFSITGCDQNVPEFPMLALPVGMILGFVFIVYSMKRKEE